MRSLIDLRRPITVLDGCQTNTSVYTAQLQTNGAGPPLIARWAQHDDRKQGLIVQVMVSVLCANTVLGDQFSLDDGAAIAPVLFFTTSLCQSVPMPDSAQQAQTTLQALVDAALSPTTVLQFAQRTLALRVFLQECRYPAWQSGPLFLADGVVRNTLDPDLDYDQAVVLTLHGAANDFGRAQCQHEPCKRVGYGDLSCAPEPNVVLGHWKTVCSRIPPCQGGSSHQILAQLGPDGMAFLATLRTHAAPVF